MLPSRSKKVTPGQQYGGKVLLNCMDVTSRRWKEGLTLQQQGKIIHVNYGQKYGQGEAVLGTWGAVAQVLGTFDSRVANRIPVWDVKILVDPIDNATLQAVRAELLSKGAGHRLYMQHLLNRCVLLRNWLPPSLPTILFCKCNCPDFEGQRAFGNAARKLEDPCKHVAAVLYDMVIEADKDPGFVMEMRGFNYKSDFFLHPPMRVPASAQIPPIGQVIASVGNPRNSKRRAGDSADVAICLD
jgi:hypothetical protein